jgi:hypothetical protein
MTRNPLLLLGALALACSGPSVPIAAAAPPLGPPDPLPSQAQPLQTQQAQTQSSQALVGTWSATVNWNLPGGIMITTSFTANGRIQSTTQNNQGMSFMLTGVYQFNASAIPGRSWTVFSVFLPTGEQSANNLSSQKV